MQSQRQSTDLKKSQLAGFFNRPNKVVKSEVTKASETLSEPPRIENPVLINPVPVKNNMSNLKKGLIAGGVFISAVATGGLSIEPLCLAELQVI